MKRSRGPSPRPLPPPPREADDRLVTVAGTAGWAVALIVLIAVRDSIPPAARWWIWTCATGVAMGLFALWYVPRLKRARARAAARAGAAVPGGPQQETGAGPAAQRTQDQPDQSAPRDSGSNTVSSTETPGKSTRS